MEKSKNNKIQIKDYIADLIVITSIISDLSKNIVAISLIILWFIFAIMENRDKITKFLFKPKKVNIYIFLWIIVSLILYAFKNKFMTDYEIKNIIRISINMLLLSYYIFFEDKIKQKHILKVTLFTIIIYCINTIRALIQYPNLSRILTTANPEKYSGFANIKFIGGYELAYSIMLLGISIFGIVYSSKTEFNEKVLNILILLVIVITLIYQQFTMSILLFAIGAIFNILKIHSIKSSIIRGGILLIFVSVITNVILNALIYLSENIEQEEVSLRLIEIKNFIENGNLDDSNDMESRIERDFNSLNTFIKDPVGIENAENKVIGGHSEILDEYAKYGFCVATITLLPFVQIYKEIYKRLREKVTKQIWFVVGVIYLLFSIFNTSMFICTTMIMFFIIPVLLLNNEKEESEKR